MFKSNNQKNIFKKIISIVPCWLYDHKKFINSIIHFDFLQVQIHLLIKFIYIFLNFNHQISFSKIIWFRKFKKLNTL